MDNSPLHFQLFSSIHDIPSTEWDRISQGHGPFLRHAFLCAMEDSESVSEKSGWQPLHLGVYQKQILIGIAPLYIKTHSYGEYVFDFAWANAYHQHGLEYYPKLINAIPFTPVAGDRIIFDKKFNSEQNLQKVIDFLTRQLDELGLSSLHCLFPTLQQSQALSERESAQRKAVQFQWFNRGYSDFDHYLASFTARRRKSVKKERQKVLSQGIEVRRYVGDVLTEQTMAHFYQCYVQTYLKRSGHSGYLTQSFFSQLLSTMKQQLLLVVAYEHELPIASALYLFDQEQLCGRYWGALEEKDGLHFECCYYQGIDFCIENNLATFNPGTQGEHKILRGFEPIFTYSNHWMKDPGFHQAVERFVTQETPGIEHYKAQAESILPFKQANK